MLLFDVTRNTVSNWVKEGLHPSDQTTPYVFNGAEVKRFHDARRPARCMPLRTGEFKCFSCRARTFPDPRSVEKEMRSGDSFSAIARCLACGGTVSKRLNETDCDKLLNCANTNTSLDSLDEEIEKIPAGIGNESGSLAKVCYFSNDRVLYAWLQFAGQWSTKTIAAKIAAIRRFENFCDGKHLSRITGKDVSRFREHLKSCAEATGADRLSVSTVRHLASHLKSFFDWLIKQNNFRELDCTLPDHFALPRKFDATALLGEARAVPTDEEAVQLIMSMPVDTLQQRRDRAMVAIAFLAALRADTITSLQVKHFDGDQRIVVQDARASRTKNGKSLRIKFFPLPACFSEAVFSWKEELLGLGFEDADALFPDGKDLSTREGRSLRPVLPMSSTHAVSRAFREASREISQSFSPHSAKHFIGQLSWRFCKSPEEFKAWSSNMGHEDERVTQKYYSNISVPRVAEIFEAFDEVETETREDKDLMLAYHEHKLDRGTPEFERAADLVLKRQLSGRSQAEIG